MENHISKKQIRRWLDNYDSLAAEDRFLDVTHVNSPAKEYDGVSMTFLNKVMLDKEISNLPAEQRACVVYRWVKRHAVRYTTSKLGISVDQYYSNCNKAVDSIYKELNGRSLGIDKLISKLL